MNKRIQWTRYSESIEPQTLLNDGGDGNSRQVSESKELMERRVRLLVAVFLVIILIMVIRLTYWQFAGDTSDVTAQAQTVKAVETRRGRILDSDGLLLATDTFTWEIYANPKECQRHRVDQAWIASLAQITGQPDVAIQNSLDGNLPIVTLAKGATEAQCQAIKDLAQPGLVWCAPRRMRAYPQGALAAHILGFTNYSLVGVYGVEASYDNWLRDDPTWSAQQLPGTPQPLPEAWKLYVPSPNGHDLVLHLNAPLQHLTEKRLAEALAFYEAEAGTIIVMDPRTGGVLALANLPTFDPNHYSDVDQNVWVNPAVGLIYEPGSVFKVITYAAALDSGVITPDTMFEDKGRLKVGGRLIRNAERQAYGKVTAEQALAKSLNVVAARISLDMGPETFYRYVHQFGFSKPTEVDLNQEGHGIVKEPGNPQWSYSDLATNSFGQGISVTALQMINAVAAVANGGRLLQPQVAQGLILNGQVYNLPPRVLGYPITPDAARTLTEMMVYNVDHSSHPNLVPGYRIAGKTGTAEIPTEQGYTSEETITSFVGFLPAADPQLIIMVKLVKPKRSRWAEHVAVPVFGQVAQDAVSVLGIHPDEREP